MIRYTRRYESGQETLHGMIRSIFDALYEMLPEHVRKGAGKQDYSFQSIGGEDESFPYPDIYAVCLEPHDSRMASRQPVCLMSVDGCPKEITVLVDEKANLTEADVSEEVNRLLSQRTS